MNTSPDNYPGPEVNSPIQVRATPTLDAIHQELAGELAEARTHFPTPTPGRLSPDSLDLGELDLAPSTTIHAVESSSEGMAEGAATNSTGSGQADEEEPEEPQGAGHATAGFDRCGAAGEDNCTFLASARQCKTHGTQCMDCNELVDHCICPGLPT